MKVVILAGGFGTRLAEETELLPKPLVEIGGKPILWHIMKIYESAGFSEFVICCGYKGYMIKNYFVNYFMENYDISVDLARNNVEFLGNPTERWKVTLVDTGQDSLTGGRVKRIQPYVGDETFCLTYGDGLADIDVRAVVDRHRQAGLEATVTAVPSPGRFGILDIDGAGHVSRFHEKPSNEMGWINGGFFVMEPSVFDRISGDDIALEKEPLETLARDGQLNTHRHTSFWMPMDSLRDKRELESLWESGEAPWKRW